MNDLEHFKMLTDMWNDHFNTMICCVSFLATAFGLVIPITFSFFERKNFKDAVEKYQKKLESQEERLKVLQSNLSKMEPLLSNALIGLAQFYLDKAGKLISQFPNMTKTEKTEFIADQIECFGNVLKCLIMSGNKKEINDKMTTLLIFAHFMKVNEAIAKDALEHLFRKNPKMIFFVHKELLSDIIGQHPKYKKFEEEMDFIFEFIENHYNITEN